MIFINKVSKRQLFLLIIPSAIPIIYITFFLSLFISDMHWSGYFIGTFVSLLILILMFGLDKLYIVDTDRFLITRKIYYWLSKEDKGQQFLMEEIKSIGVIENEKAVHYTGLIPVFIYLKDKPKVRVKFCIIEDKNYKTLLEFITFLQKKNIVFAIRTKNKRLQEILKRNGML